jgi:type I restriction enzyme S subunit
MPDELKPFGTLLEYPLRSGVTVAKDSRGSGIRMVNMRELFRYPRLGDVGMARVQIDMVDESRFLLREGDIILARRSLTAEGAGKCSILISVPERTTWESSIIRARLAKNCASPEFYYYYFSSEAGRRSIETIVEQVAAAGIRSSDLARLMVPAPSLAKQQAIVSVLSALDDKIAVNDRIATVSGSLLRAHFAQASVDAGREVKLGDLMELKYGKALKAEGRTRGRIPVFGGNGVSGWHDVALEGGPGVIVGRKGANAGSVTWSQGPFWPIDTSFYVESISTPLEFLLCLLESAGLRNHVGDSAIPGLNREIALGLTIRIPSDEAIRQFVETAMPILALRAQVLEESHAIAEMRDTLLPKLMSGEIRVRDAET